MEVSALAVVKERLDLVSLFPELDLITDRVLRDAVAKLWNELWEMSEFQNLKDVPISAGKPYPEIKHCQGVLRVALAVAAVLEEVHGARFDRDILIAGALLMDVGKFVELKPKAGGGVQETDLGRALPHAIYAAHRALELGIPLPVVHIITTHSRNQGKSPNTPECALLDWIDQVDLVASGLDSWARKLVFYHSPAKEAATHAKAQPAEGADRTR